MGFFGGQVAVIDRDLALRRRSGSKGEVGAEDEVLAVGGEGLGDVAGGFGGGAGMFGARHALDQFAAGQVRGMPVEPSAKQGEQISGPPKAKVSKAGVGFERGSRQRATVEGVALAGMPTYSVRPAIFAAGGEVGVEAAVGGVAGAGDAAAVDAVEERGRRRSG